MNETCKICEKVIPLAEVFYCYRCGAAHHEECFVETKKCGTGKCVSTICVSNADGRTINCLTTPPGSGQNADVSVGAPDSVVGKSLKDAEKDTSPILLVLSMLFSLMVFLLATVWIFRMTAR